MHNVDMARCQCAAGSRDGQPSSEKNAEVDADVGTWTEKETQLFRAAILSSCQWLDFASSVRDPAAGQLVGQWLVPTVQVPRIGWTSVCG